MSKTISVKDLREKFEKKSTVNGSKPLTPYEFSQQQQKASKEIARNITEARQKASTYNMTVRALQIKTYTGSGKASVPANAPYKKNESINSVNAQGSRPPSKSVDDINVRVKARKYSVSLQKSLEETSSSTATTTTSTTSTTPLTEKETKTRITKVNFQLPAKATSVSSTSAGSVSDNDVFKAKQDKGNDERRMTRSATEVESPKRFDEMMKQKPFAESPKAANQTTTAATAATTAVTIATTATTTENVNATPSDNATSVMERRETIEEKNDRIILESYLRENYPHKLSEVDSLLIEYEGHLDILFEELARIRVEEEQKKSSVVGGDDSTLKEDLERLQSHLANSGIVESLSPKHQTEYASIETEAVDAISEVPLSLENVLMQFYSVFAPAKVAEIPEIMKYFKTHESEMIRMVELKYDVTFLEDGSCVPNKIDEGGEPFVSEGERKRRTLRERLSTKSKAE